MSRTTGEALSASLIAATAADDHARHNFAGPRADLATWLRNDAANHRQEIVAAYRSGQTAESLGAGAGASRRAR